MDFITSACSNLVLDGFTAQTASSVLVGSNYEWSRCTGSGIDSEHTTVMETCSSTTEFDGCSPLSSVTAYPEECVDTGDVYSEIICPSTLLMKYTTTEAGSIQYKFKVFTLNRLHWRYISY